MPKHRPSRRRLLALAGGGAASSFALALAGCLGDGGTGSTDGDNESDGNESDDPRDAADENSEDGGNGDGNDANDETEPDIVEIETREGDANTDEPDFVFDPPVVALEPETTVRWVNTDGVFHTVTATDDLESRTPSEAFDETLSSEGDTFEWTPADAEKTDSDDGDDENESTAGLQHYYCAPHVGFMYGTLVVGEVDADDIEVLEDAYDEETLANLELDLEALEDGADDSGDESDAIDEEFVDMTGEEAVTIETRDGDDDADEPDFVFDPAFVTVDEGTTIEWVNTDGVFHTVTSTDDIGDRSGGGDEFDATISSEGDTFEWDADEPGTQPYYCSPHAGFMYGALEVE